MAEKISNKEYRMRPGVSRSELQLLRKSPKHLEYALQHRGEEDTKALAFGRAVHKWILEEDTFFDEFCICPTVDRRTKEGKAEWERFLLSSDSREVITEAEMEQIVAMKDVINASPFVSHLLKGETEMSFFWTDEETGETCKCRPDCLSTFDGKKVIVDYKTTEDCSHDAFRRSCNKYGYKLQAGMYREGLFQNTFDDYGFVFVAQEKKAPYCVNVFLCFEDFISEGYDEYRALLGIYHRCNEEDKFPGYEGFDEEYDILEGDEC